MVIGVTMRAAVVACALAGLVTASACSNDDEAKTETTAPEDRRAPAGAVATGLHQIDEIAQQIAAAASDSGKAKELDEKIEPIWEDVEGTVKANDKNAYLAFEDAFALLAKAAKAGTTADAQSAAAKVSQTVREYLARFPG